VLAASRRARESLDGVVAGSLFPERLLQPADGREPLAIPIEIGDRHETLLYVGRSGDLASYEELRAGFTAAVSHELRTPLARLMVLLDNLSLPGSDAVELANRARAEVETIGELIDDVLFLSELESGRVVVSLGSARVLPVLQGVLAERAERAERAGVQLLLECPEDLELPLRPRMLATVGGNLADNALRYAGPDTTFSLVARSEGSGAVLLGFDDGAGVPEGDVPRLFERFFRSDRARTSQGTGLGLAIVKHIVTSAGGTVEARNRPDGGLEIRCAFPSRL
jgi:two-component system phosphate regulon sensor histidine kinase PhoR